MAMWINCRLFCLEAKQFIGGRAVLVANLLAVDHGLAIDVRHITAKGYDRATAVGGMLDITGKPYGWNALLHATLSKVVLLRWLIRPSRNDHQNVTAPYCSMAISRESRRAGFDPVGLLGDAWTEPGDLGRVPDALAHYAGTLSLWKGKLRLQKEEIE
jgi:hypothetical protein